MILSHSSKTAIKSVIYLAGLFDTGHKASIREVAEEIDENEHTIAKLLQSLVHQEIIMSSKGPSGGFFVTADQKEQTLLRVIEAVEGRHVFGKCGLGLKHCSAKTPCPIHFEYEEARTKAEQLFRRKKISELCEVVSSGKAYLKEVI